MTYTEIETAATTPIPECVDDATLAPIAALRATYQVVATRRGEAWAEEWLAQVTSLIRGD